MARNKIQIDHLVRHEVNLEPQRGNPCARGRLLLAALGDCNGVRFEVLVRYEIGIDSHIIFLEPTFSKTERASIRRKTKSAKPDETVVHPTSKDVTEAAEIESNIYEEMWGRYHGEKVFLGVPFEEKDAAKALGAMWDGIEKKCYFWSKDHPSNAFSKWLRKESVE